MQRFPIKAERHAVLRYRGAHGDRDRRAIAVPAAKARNESSTITGTGGRGVSPPPEVEMPGAARGASSMLA
jgi:hypothetical protein